jgi:hypothetical protein
MMLFDNAINIISDMDAIAESYVKNEKYWAWRLADWQKRRNKRHTERLNSEGHNLV